MEFLRLYSEMREKRVNKRESWKTKIKEGEVWVWIGKGRC